MSDDKEFGDSLLWAESIVRDRQNIVQNKAATTSKLKIALYIFFAVIAILLLVYIIYRAYKIPDPMSILDEVKSMTNQVQPSGTDGFTSDD